MREAIYLTDNSTEQPGYTAASFNDHAPSHFHVITQSDERVSVVIQTLAILAGEADSRDIDEALECVLNTRTTGSTYETPMTPATALRAQLVLADSRASELIDGVLQPQLNDFFELAFAFSTARYNAFVY